MAVHAADTVRHLRERGRAAAAALAALAVVQAAVVATVAVAAAVPVGVAAAAAAARAAPAVKALAVAVATDVAAGNEPAVNLDDRRLSADHRHTAGRTFEVLGVDVMPSPLPCDRLTDGREDLVI